MNKLEEEFGPVAKFISAHAGKKIDVPEALIPVFEPLEEYGIWNIPWVNESMAFAKKTNYPTSLDLLWPEAQPKFIGIAWDKWYGRYLDKKVGKGPSFPANEYATNNYEEFNRIAKQVRSFETVEEVVKSGLITKLCDLYFENADFYESFLRSGPRSGKMDEDWLDEEPLRKLAHFFTPANELLKVLEGWFGGSSDSKYSSKELVSAPIFIEIVKCVIAKWGDRRPAKVLAHKQHENKYPSPDGDLACEICAELREERTALCEELAQRTAYPNAGSIPALKRHLSKQSLVSTKNWIAEQAEIIEDRQRLQEEIANEIYKPLSAPKDLVVEEVVAFVTRLTKLGVSPNKAAETATKLIKLA